MKYPVGVGMTREAITPVVVWLVLAGLGGAPAAGQSLAEAARRERERRKSLPAASTSLTEEDLHRVHDPAQAATSKASPSPNPSPRATPPPPALDPALEAAWRRRFADARQRARQAEAAAWQTRVQVVFVSGIPVQQAVRVFEETDEVRASRKTLEDLEEELRRAGLPPGWGRE
jgi:hypothetical protein